MSSVLNWMGKAGLCSMVVMLFLALHSYQPQIYQRQAISFPYRVGDRLPGRSDCESKWFDQGHHYCTMTDPDIDMVYDDNTGRLTYVSYKAPPGLLLAQLMEDWGTPIGSTELNNSAHIVYWPGATVFTAGRWMPDDQVTYLALTVNDPNAMRWRGF